LILAAFFAGCNAPKSDLKKFNKYFKTECLKGSDFKKSMAFAKSKVGKGKKPKAENLLWAMQMGCLERIRQNHQESTEYFDRSEEMLKYFDYQNKAVDSVAAIAVSDNVVPYLGEEYDGIMVNTYKALNFMVLGQEDLARVEFNRALDRQRIATEKFAKELQKLKKEIEQQQKKEKSQVKRNIENPKVKQAIEKKYPGLYEFEAYADFVNPFTTYIAGVFFNLVGDHSKAAPLLKQSYGMVSDNEYIAEDLAVTERILDGQEELKDTLWVIFENGLGPIKKEFRVDLPLFLVTSKVKYVGIALPKLAFREQAYPYLSIKAAGNNCTTQLVADMDRVVQTEFSKDFQGILTRAIISATAKALTQYAFEEAGGEGGAIASIIFAVYSFATTAADVRIWTTLPKDFQVARLPIPDDRLVTITPAGAPPLEVKISPCKNAVLYVRIPFKQAGLVYDLITY
jgi:hypothetical protein